MSEDINADEIESIELINSSRTNRGKEYEWDPETSRWTKGDHDRLYFNDSQYVDYLDLNSLVGHREGSAVKIRTELNGDELSVEVEVYEKSYSATFKLHGLDASPAVEPRETDFEYLESCVSEPNQEIVTDGGEDKNSHIEDDAIEGAIESNDDKDHPDALTVAEVRDALAEIQASFEGFWAEHMDAIEDGHLEVVAETEHVVVFADHTGQGWNEELDALGLDRDRSSNDRVLRITLAETHHRAASRLCDRNWSTADPFVVAKPEGVRNGQLFVETIINSLLQRGLSPGQAWAYYGVEIRGNSRNSWSKRCGYNDHSAVSEPLRKAQKKLP